MVACLGDGSLRNGGPLVLLDKEQQVAHAMSWDAGVCGRYAISDASRQEIGS